MLSSFISYISDWERCANCSPLEYLQCHKAPFFKRNYEIKLLKRWLMPWSWSTMKPSHTCPCVVASVRCFLLALAIRLRSFTWSNFLNSTHTSSVILIVLEEGVCEEEVYYTSLMRKHRAWEQKETVGKDEVFWGKLWKTSEVVQGKERSTSLEQSSWGKNIGVNPALFVFLFFIIAFFFAVYVLQYSQQWHSQKTGTSSAPQTLTGKGEALCWRHS